MKPMLCTLALVLVSTPILQAEEKGDKGQATPSLATVRDLLGKRSDSKEVQAVVKTLSGQPKISRYDDCSYHVYYDDGIDFRFDMKGVITTIFLFAEGADKHKAYQGELPAGLKFASTRGEVEKKLGKPDGEFGGCGVLHYQENYNKQGFDVRYFSKDKSDLKAKVRSFTIFPARNK